MHPTQANNQKNYSMINFESNPGMLNPGAGRYVTT